MSFCGPGRGRGRLLCSLAPSCLPNAPSRIHFKKVVYVDSRRRLQLVGQCEAWRAVVARLVPALDISAVEGRNRFAVPEPGRRALVVHGSATHG